MTVGALVRQWLHPGDDPWHLALVQRDRVWNPLRVARLFDSLLAGYPIGTLLLCRLHQDTYILSRDRSPKPAPPGTWQLLDGQQRIHALVALFADEPGFERYFLEMFGRRWWDENVVTQQRGRAAATSYILSRATDDEAQTWNTLANRSSLLRLAGISDWIGPDSERATRSRDAIRAAVAADDGQALRQALTILREIDPEFMSIASLSETQCVELAERTIRLLAVWDREIPVHRTELEDEQDVLQVFERVNLEGVRIAGDDVYFAAVKTRWPSAEPSLRQVVAAVPVLDRLAVLRLLSRLAALADGQGDVLPLRVDRLNGVRGAEIRKRLEQLCGAEGAAFSRMRRTANALITDSGLGYGLRLVQASLYDAVFAWAACNPRLDHTGPSEEDLAAIAGFLIGGTIYGYAAVLDDAWARLVLQIAMHAGSAGAPFPIANIVEETRARWPTARNGQRSLSLFDTPAIQRKVASDHAALMLSLVQELPFDLPPRTRLGQGLPSREPRQIEWDHIWPANQQRRMRVSRKLADGAERVNHIGNFWALDRPLNNFLRDRPPSEKFAFLGEPTTIVHMPDRWPDPSAGFLTDLEMTSLVDVERRLWASGRSEAEVREATKQFADLVDGRGDRIIAGVLARFPATRTFIPVAVDQTVREPREAWLAPEEIAQALGLPAPSEKKLVRSEATIGQDLDPVIDKAATVNLDTDLLAIIDAVQSIGLRPVGVRPARSDTPAWIKVGVVTSGYQRAQLFAITPEPARRSLRVNVAPINLRWLLGMTNEQILQVFGPGVEREWLEGDAPAFISEVLERLRPIVASPTIPAGIYE